MKATPAHLVYFIQNFETNVQQYKDLFAYFECPILFEEKDVIGFQCENLSLFFLPATENTPNHRDSNGLNHFAFTVESKQEVDTFATEFLAKHNIPTLFDTPRSRTEFADKDADYYQVIFELPGTLLFEVVAYK